MADARSWVTRLSDKSWVAEWEWSDDDNDVKVKAYGPSKKSALRKLAVKLDALYNAIEVSGV